MSANNRTVGREGQPHALRGCKCRMACTNRVRSTDSVQPCRDPADRDLPPRCGGGARLRRAFRRPGPASGRKASPRRPCRGEGNEALKASEMVPRQLCETSGSRVPFVVRLLPRSRGGCTAASPTSSSAPLPGQGRVSWRRPCRQDARRKRAPSPQAGDESRSGRSRYGRGESVLRTRFVHAIRDSHPRKAWG